MIMKFVSGPATVFPNLFLLLCSARAFVSPLSKAIRPALIVPQDSHYVTRQLTTRLFVNVASELLMKDWKDKDKNGPGLSKEEKRKLTRPERKALERRRKPNKKKTTGNRKHNYKDRADILNSARQPGEGPYDLHSNAVSELTKESSIEDVMRAIKRAQNHHDVHDIKAIERFLLEEAGDDFGFGYRGSMLARLAVAALHMNKHKLAAKALQERAEKHAESVVPLESSAIVRGLLRVDNVSDAFEVLETELSLPPEGTPLDTEESRDLIIHRAHSLGSIVSRLFFEGEPYLAVHTCQMLAALGSTVKEAGITAKEIDMPWARIIKGAGQCESQRREGTLAPQEGIDEPWPCNMIYAVLQAMYAFPLDNENDTYESLSNGLVRRTCFVSGAVSMETLPKADRGEAAFIGRSNVGKSSLVNMITNRKSLAYTSKTPGKTQQFNYFAVNDKPDLEREIRFGDVVGGTKDADSFYIVDLPGFGYAKVPDHVRLDWSQFMGRYMTERKTLKVLFHLVDSRHGPTGEDKNIMKMVGDMLPRNVKYVVVLTKADKNVGKKKRDAGKVSHDVVDKLTETMAEAGVGDAPIVLTSAETKLGRDDIWRYLRLAAEAYVGLTP